MINLKVKSDVYFKRDGSDIYTDLYVTVSQVISFFYLSYKGNIRSWGENQNSLWRYKTESWPRYLKWRKKETS